MSHTALALSLLIAAVAAASDSPFRLPRSPYPAPQAGPNCARKLYVFDDTLLSQSQLLTLQTMQGVLARQCPQLIRTGSGQAGDMQSAFAADLAAYGVALDTTLRGNFTALLALFRDQFTGYALCNAASGQEVWSLEHMYAGSTRPAPARAPPAAADVSCNVAIALSAAYGSVLAVALPDQAAVEALGLKMLFDARTMSPADVLNSMAGRGLSKTTAVLQAPEKYTFLSDYAPFARAFTFWDDGGRLPSNLSQQVLHALQPPAAVLGWGSSEGGSVDTLAAFGDYIHAADWATNLATLTSFYVPQFQQSRAATESVGQGVGKHTVTFLMTDGDNVQWLLSGFSSPLNDWYGSAERGKVAIGWTVSPAMAELAPSVLQRFYRTAAPGRDVFVAGPSGVGYTVPDKFSSAGALAAFANATGAYMQRADLRIVNIIADTDCDVACSQPFVQAGADAVFLYEGGGYVGRAGRVSWLGDVPVVGGRYALWGRPGDGFEDPASLARKLRLLPSDPRNPDAYSLIPVHVWTHNVSDVLATVALLGDAGFDVVTPETFVQRLRDNVPHDCPAAQPAAGSFTSRCHGGTDSCGVLRNVLCADGRGHDVANPFFDHSGCPGQRVGSCFGRLQCDGDPCP